MVNKKKLQTLYATFSCYTFAVNVRIAKREEWEKKWHDSFSYKSKLETCLSRCDGGTVQSLSFTKLCNHQQKVFLVEEKKTCKNAPHTQQIAWFHSQWEGYYSLLPNFYHNKNAAISSSRSSSSTWQVNEQEEEASAAQRKNDEEATRNQPTNNEQERARQSIIVISRQAET